VRGNVDERRYPGGLHRNAKHEPLPDAEAQRKLQAVGSMPSLDLARVRTRRTSRRQPTASAYFCKVASEGECLPLLNDASKRVTAGGFVPIRSATCAWVSPAAWRACNIWRKISNVGPSAS
jgi:hypothetical protein